MKISGQSFAPQIAPHVAAAGRQGTAIPPQPPPAQNKRAGGRRQQISRWWRLLRKKIQCFETQHDQHDYHADHADYLRNWFSSVRSVTFDSIPFRSILFHPVKSKHHSLRSVAFGFLSSLSVSFSFFGCLYVFLVWFRKFVVDSFDSPFSNKEMFVETCHGIGTNEMKLRAEQPKQKKQKETSEPLWHQLYLRLSLEYNVAAHASTIF